MLFLQRCGPRSLLAYEVWIIVLCHFIRRPLREVRVGRWTGLLLFWDGRLDAGGLKTHSAAYFVVLQVFAMAVGCDSNDGGLFFHPDPIAWLDRPSDLSLLSLPLLVRQRRREGRQHDQKIDKRGVYRDHPFSLVAAEGAFFTVFSFFLSSLPLSLLSSLFCPLHSLSVAHSPFALLILITLPPVSPLLSSLPAFPLFCLRFSSRTTAHAQTACILYQKWVPSPLLASLHAYSSFSWVFTTAHPCMHPFPVLVAAAATSTTKLSLAAVSVTLSGTDTPPCPFRSRSSTS